MLQQILYQYVQHSISRGQANALNTQHQQGPGQCSHPVQINRQKVHDFPEWRTIRSLVLWFEILSESIQHMHLVSHQPVYKSSFFLDLRDNWNQWKLLKRKSTHKNPHLDKEAADFSIQDKPAVTMTKSSKYLMQNLNNFLGKKLSRQRTYPILID